MKTNTNNNRGKIIAAVAILLLAVGAGGLYIHDQRTPNNSQDQSASAALNTGTPAVTDPTVPAIAAVDNTPQASAESASVVGTPVRHSRHNSNSAVSADEDQVGITTVKSYEGNMPAALPAQAETPATQVARKFTTIQKTGTRTTGRGSSYNTVNLALELGGNLNGFNNSNPTNQLTNGFHVGFMANIRLSNAIALQPGLQYTMKGNEDKSTTTNEGMQVNTTNNITLNYIEMPVNLVYKFGDIMGSPRFMIGAGPYVSYLMNANNKFQSNTINAEGFAASSQNYTMNTTSDFKKLDFGLGGFVGCQMPKGLYAKAGAELGLMNAAQVPVDGKYADRNYSFLISVGYIFGAKNNTY